MALTKVIGDGLGGTNDLTVDTTTLTVDATNNRVGVGTASPATGLHVEESTTGDAVKIARGGNFIIIGGSGSGTQYIKGYEANVAFGNEFTGNTLFLTGDSEKARIDNAGHFFLGTTSERNAGDLSIDFSGTSEAGIGINDTTSSNGSVFAGFLTGGTFRGSISNNNNGAVAYNTTSDYRLKENVSYDFDATARLKQLKPTRFNWIADDTNTSQDGFLAHEVSSIVPEAITGTKDETRTTKNVVLDKNENIIANNITEDEWKTAKADGTYDDNTSWKSTITQKHYQQIDHSKLVPLLVKTIQELEARIAKLEGS